ncbi:MAG: mechanosensitive ion channel [bacterium]|nr:mechanosensitive ion channel [bacterium]
MAIALYYSSVVTNIVAGILVIGFGILVGNIFSIIGKKVLQSFEIEKIFQERGVRFPFEEFIGSIIKYGIYIAGLILGLGFLGLEKILLYVILVIILGLLIAFILLSLKDFIPNFIAGLIIYMKSKLRTGDIVEIDTIEGKVIHTDMLEAKIRTKDGDVVIMPNILVLRSTITKKRK